MSVHTLLLQPFDLLQHLPEATRTQLASCGATRTVAKREMVLPKGSAPSFLGFLMEGRLQAIDFTVEGREAGLYFIEPGDYFGELALIDGESQAEFIIASERSQILTFPSKVIRPLLFASATGAEALARRLAQRVRQQLGQRQILSVPNPLLRVCAQIQLLLERQDNAPDPFQTIRAPTHQELAIMINLTRETVTRSFQVLLTQGVLTRQSDKLRVDTLKLEQLLQGPQD